MDLRQLEYAVAVAEELSFTRAAARCHIAQSGLSHQIAQLEKELGAALFQRTSRSVALSPEGQVFLPHARRILGEVEDARAALASLRGIVRGRLRLGSIPFAGQAIDLLGLLRDFRRAYPGIDITLTDEGSLSTVTSLQTGQLDVAFVGLFPQQTPDGVAATLLVTEPLVAVVGVDHALRGAGAVSLAQLVTGNAFIDSHTDSGLRSQVDDACTRARARRSVVCELRNPGDITSLALQGIGVAVVPQRVAQAVAVDHPDCVLRLDDPRAVQPISLVHRDPRPAGPAALAFLDLALRRLH